PGAGRGRCPRSVLRIPTPGTTVSQMIGRLPVGAGLRLFSSRSVSVFFTGWFPRFYRLVASGQHRDSGCGRVQMLSRVTPTYAQLHVSARTATTLGDATHRQVTA